MPQLLYEDNFYARNRNIAYQDRNEPEYPSVIYEGNKFSLIEPYTINDKLIIDFEIRNTTISSYYDYNNVDIHFKLIDESRFVISVSLEELHERLNFLYENVINSDWSCLNHNIIRELHHIDEHHHMGRSYLEIISEDIKSQCAKFQMDPYGSAQSMKRELHRQGRNYYVSDDCYDVYDDWIRFNIPPYISYEPTPAPEYTQIFTTDHLLNAFCSIGSSDTQRSIIHSHSYIPEYKKHFLDGESETTTLLLGAEIEVDCGGENKDNAKEVLKIMNGENWENEENVYCVHDGSLNRGLEFPTMPGSLNWHKTLNYKEMFKFLDSKGYKAHDAEKAGLHIHINRSYFEDKESECIGKLMYILEKFNDEFSIIGRRSCRYAKLLGYNGEKCEEMYSKGYKNRDKYNAINLLHLDTIEIRCFKSTLKYETYILTLEFVQDLAEYVKNHSEEEIEEMSWNDLYNTFSDELKAYYDKRKKIEVSKKENISNSSSAADSENIFVTSSFNVCSSSTNRNRSRINTIDSLRNMFESGICMNESEVLNQIHEVYNNLSITAYEEQTKEQNLKQLKKQLKNEKNYMARKEISKKIQKLQIKIKKERKINSETN